MMLIRNELEWSVNVFNALWVVAIKELNRVQEILRNKLNVFFSKVDILKFIKKMTFGINWIFPKFENIKHLHRENNSCDLEKSNSLSFSKKFQVQNWSNMYSNHRT